MSQELPFMERVMRAHAVARLLNNCEDRDLTVMAKITNEGAFVDGLALLLYPPFHGRQSDAPDPEVAHRVSRLMLCLDPRTRASLLKGLRGRWSDGLTGLMAAEFNEETLSSMPTTVIQKAISSVDTRTLCLVVKGEEKATQGFVLSLMGERTAKLLMDEIANVGPVALSEVEQAKAAFVEALHDAMDSAA
jgi:hypothetical protein